MTEPDAGHGTPVAEHAGHAAHSPAADLRFEKTELEEFMDADRGAGQHIGILLAALFVLLLVLMTGATLWTFLNRVDSDDPHAVPAAVDRSGH